MAQRILLRRLAPSARSSLMQRHALDEGLIPTHASPFVAQHLLLVERHSSSSSSSAATAIPPPPSSPSSSSSSSSSLSPPPLPDGFLPDLTARLPHLDVITNKYDLETHGRGESHHPSAPPHAVLRPTSSADVSTILSACTDHVVPVVPYGAGTSLEGHVSCLRGGVSLDLTGLDRIEYEEGREEDFLCKVGAGVTRKTLNEALRHTGMQFMVDPGADATIGGMVATNASGTMTVKYGKMRENVLGLECVLPDGTLAKCGTDALKSSAGYDLTSLLTGSEGTLAVITSVTVKLHPVPEHVTAAVCSFDDLSSAAGAVSALKMSGVAPTRLELLDAISVGAFNRYREARRDEFHGAATLDEKPTLFLEFDGPSAAAVRERVELSKSVCENDFGATGFDVASDDAERRRLWAARHNAYYAELALRPGSNGGIVTDACVPLSRFVDVVTETEQDVRDLGVVGPILSHAGDGNFHVTLPLRDDDPDEYVARAHEVNDRLVRRTIAAGGTCTGEHGVGYGKLKYLEQQYGSGTLHMMRLVKKAIDPLNIMNPDKIVSM